MQDADIRARILQELYNRKREGKELVTSPEQYAAILGITPELANFNIQYLISKGLVEGKALGTLGTTRKFVLMTDISALGIEAVEGQGHSREGYAINFSIINIGGSISNSQVAGGNVGSQNKLDAQGSKGVNIIGDRNVVETGGKKAVEMPTYLEKERSWIKLGRLLMMSLFKTLNHSLTPLYLGASLSTIALTGLIGVAYYAGSLGSVTGSPIGLVALVALLLVATILWSTSLMGRETTCPRCDSKFTYLRTNRIMTGRANLPEADVRNYEDTYRCSSCGFEMTGVKKTVSISKEE